MYVCSRLPAPMLVATGEIKVRYRPIVGRIRGCTLQHGVEALSLAAVPLFKLTSVSARNADCSFSSSARFKDSREMHERRLVPPDKVQRCRFQQPGQNLHSLKDGKKPFV